MQIWSAKLRENGDLLLTWTDGFPFEPPLPTYTFEGWLYKYDHTLPCDLNDFTHSQVNSAGQITVTYIAVYKPDARPHSLDPALWDQLPD